jgi:hypothetical protein
LTWHARAFDLRIAAVAGGSRWRADRPLETSLDAAGLSIVHVKVLDRTPTGYVRASVCAPGAEPVLEGSLDASPALWHDLMVNARAIGDPVQLSRLVAESLEFACERASRSPRARRSGRHRQGRSGGHEQPNAGLKSCATGERGDTGYLWSRTLVLLTRRAELWFGQRGQTHAQNRTSLMTWR